MSVTAWLTSLATDPVRLEEFRANPEESLAAARIEESSAAAVLSRDPSRVRDVIASETGAATREPVVHIIITVTVM
jgi:hypothetical protein